MKKKILYVGLLNPGQTCMERMKALQELGHEVVGINSGNKNQLWIRIIDKIARMANITIDLTGLNRKILQQVSLDKFNVLWVDKGTGVQAKTLRRVKLLQPDCRLVHLNPDDPFGYYRKGWSTFLKAIPFYDVHFVARTPNIEEYIKIGGRNIYVYDRSYSSSLHRPLQLSSEDLKKYQVPVGFIGSCASDRSKIIAFLIQNGVPVAIYGDGWQNNEYWDIIQPHFRGHARYGEEYVKAINGMHIALHFLRHENRDEQDSRTFEIPACGTFMLAERSHKHEEFFRDGEEAVFFDTQEDLLEKVKYYLLKPEEVEKIRVAGRRRCVESGYSHIKRMQKMIIRVC